MILKRKKNELVAKYKKKCINRREGRKEKMKK